MCSLSAGNKCIWEKQIKHMVAGEVLTVLNRVGGKVSLERWLLGEAWRMWGNQAFRFLRGKMFCLFEQSNNNRYFSKPPAWFPLKNIFLRWLPNHLKLISFFLRELSKWMNAYISWHWGRHEQSLMEFSPVVFPEREIGHILTFKEE